MLPAGIHGCRVQCCTEHTGLEDTSHHKHPVSLFPLTGSNEGVGTKLREPEAIGRPVVAGNAVEGSGAVNIALAERVGTLCRCEHRGGVVAVISKE